MLTKQQNWTALTRFFNPSLVFLLGLGLGFHLSIPNQSIGGSNSIGFFVSHHSPLHINTIIVLSRMRDSTSSTAINPNPIPNPNRT
jgi:hypothetical protein